MPDERDDERDGDASYLEEEEEEDELDEHLAWLGIPAEHADEFGWIAREASRAPFPAGWETVDDEDGAACYVHLESGARTSEHPTFTRYRDLYERELALAEEGDERDRAGAEAAAVSDGAYLVVVDVPADAADEALEATLARAFGPRHWERVRRCSPFIDSGNVRHVLLCFDSVWARGQALALGALTLPGHTSGACELEAVDSATAAAKMEAMALESRCVCVRRLPLGIDAHGIARIFDIVDGEFSLLTIEDVDDERGASAVLEFTESIAARRCAHRRRTGAARAPPRERLRASATLRTCARARARSVALAPERSLPLTGCGLLHIRRPPPSPLTRPRPSPPFAAAARIRAMAFDLFSVDGRYLEVTLGSVFQGQEEAEPE